MFEDGAEKYRDDIAHLALLTTAYALVAITQAWSRLCGIELGPVDSQMDEAFLRAFPRSSSGRPA